MDKRRIALLSLFVVAAVAIGFALYFFFFRNPPKIAPKVSVKTQIPSLSEAGEGGTPVTSETETPSAPPLSEPTSSETAQGGTTQTTVITSNSTLGITAAPNTKGGVAYYDKSDGKFYKVDGTKKIALSDKQFFDVQKVAWSPTSEKAVMKFPDGFSVLYDFKEQKQITLPSHWDQFQFSNTGSQIAATSKGINDSQNWLLTMNDDGTNAKGIEPLGGNGDKVIVAWNPGNEVVAFSKTGAPMGGESNEIYLIGQNGENFKSLVVDGYDFRPQWAPDGKKLFYSTYSSRNDYKPMVWVVDAEGSNVGANRRELGINTWADKCTVQDSNSLICAVPDELPRGAGFNQEVAKGTPDTFYKIDTQTGLKTKLATPDISVNAKDLVISEDGTSLFFRNTFTNQLEKMKLK